MKKLLENQSERRADRCRFCFSRRIVKKGKRKKKHEEIQIYYCKDCGKRFVTNITKHKRYPLRVIIDGLTMYNRFMSIKDVLERINNLYGLKVTRQTFTNWLNEFSSEIPFLRIRNEIIKRHDAVEEIKMFHNQVYNFRYHRAKTEYILEHPKHRRFFPLKEFLELVTTECPHEPFKNSTKRASKYRNVFNFDKVKFVPKFNTATRMANFVAQAISQPRMRHEIVEEFMFFNDTVTVACEVPLLLHFDDIRHLKYELGFEIPYFLDEDEYITGHVDMIQIRNGYIHILDFKPNPKERPVDQLTIYALALSRLTGLRLYDFKCAWFNSRTYYEFFPLHVVYKKKKRFPKDQKPIKSFTTHK